MSTSVVDHDATYTPCSAELFSAREWPLCDDIADPRLGLRFEQLTEAWEPLGLPLDWSPEVAAQFANATWMVLSRFVGRMVGARVQWGELAQRITEVSVTDAPPRPLAFPSFAQEYARRVEETGVLGVAFGGPRARWERLVNDVGLVRDVHGGLGTRPWRVTSVDDYSALDKAWQRALTAADGEELPPLLPMRVLTAFAPGRRLVEDDLGAVAVPSLWELTATVLFRGPADWQRRGMQYLRLRIESHQTGRGRDAGRPAGNARRTLTRRATHCNSVARAARDLMGHAAVLAPWEVHLPVVVTRATLQEATTPTPRGAPSLHRFRHEYTKLRRRYERDVKATKHAATWATTREAGTVKRLLMAGLSRDVGLRANELARLRVRHFDGAHHFPGALCNPAVFLTPSKGTDLTPPVAPHWRAISHDTFHWFGTWTAGLNLTQPDHALIPAKLSDLMTPADPAVLSRFFAGTSGRRPVIPHPLGGGYGEHEVRHLVSQLALGVGGAWLGANPEWTDRVSPQVFSDAALAQKFPERYDYGDLEANRELWALRAALGDPQRGVPGYIELLRGSAGARHKWDDEAIRTALSTIAGARAEHASASEAHAAAKRRIERASAALDSAPRIAEVERHDVSRALVLTQKQLQALHAKDDLRDERENAREQRREAERRMDAAQRARHLAEAHLELIEARGPSVTIDDIEPLPTDGEVRPETETFQQALARVSEVVELAQPPAASRSVEAEETLFRDRTLLNFHELAALYAVDPRSVRRWYEGTRNGPLAHEELKAAVVELGERLRFVDVLLLPDSWLSTLSVSQRQMLEQLLRVPMGSTQFGGPTRLSEQGADEERASAEARSGR